MAITLTVIKTPNGEFAPLTEYDKQLSGSLKANTPYKIEIRQISARSLPHHRLFFGGLLPFAYQYAKQTGALITDGETKAVTDFSDWLDNLADNDDHAFRKLSEKFLTQLGQERAEKYDALPMDLEMFRKWLTVQAGHYTLYQTPNGVRKEPKSISFANMSQEEFHAFYRAASGVVWNILRQYGFENETKMQAAIHEYLEMS